MSFQFPLDWSRQSLSNHQCNLHLRGARKSSNQAQSTFWVRSASLLDAGATRVIGIQMHTISRNIIYVIISMTTINSIGLKSKRTKWKSWQTLPMMKGEAGKKNVWKRKNNGSAMKRKTWSRKKSRCIKVPNLNKFGQSCCVQYFCVQYFYDTFSVPVFFI